MKGIAKKMVEIIEPQHEYIERVLVVLRPDCPDVGVEARRAQAEKYVAELVCWRKKLWTSWQGLARTGLICVGGVCAIGLLVVLLWQG